MLSSPDSHYILLNNASTTGNSQELFVERSEESVKKYLFNHRINKSWNSLIQHMIDTTRVISLENYRRLDKLWNIRPLKYKYRTFPESDDQITEERNLNRCEHRGQLASAQKHP